MRSEGAKPQEVLDLHGITLEAFEVLRHAFGVPPDYALPLVDVDQLVDHREPVDVAAFAMRHLQVVRRVSAPDCPLLTEHFVGVIAVLVPSLDELSDMVPQGRQRALLLDARRQLYGAAWAVVRDTGGPAAGLFDLR